MLFDQQVKAVLRGQLPPFSSAYVEAAMAVVNLQSKQARKLQASNSRYWTIEYLRQQPRGTQYQALVLRFVRDGEPLVLIEEVCHEYLIFAKNGVVVAEALSSKGQRIHGFKIIDPIDHIVKSIILTGPSLYHQKQ